MTTHPPAHTPQRRWDPDPVMRSVWPFRMEDQVTDDEYIVGAELPGLRGERDIRLTVHEGWLTVQARPPQYDRDAREFAPMSATVRRMVNLPPGVDPDRATATYRGGVLQVRFPFHPPTAVPTRIPVTA